MDWARERESRGRRAPEGRLRTRVGNRGGDGVAVAADESLPPRVPAVAFVSAPSELSARCERFRQALSITAYSSGMRDLFRASHCS